MEKENTQYGNFKSKEAFIKAKRAYLIPLRKVLSDEDFDKAAHDWRIKNGINTFK